jgi:hypothetical protein
MGLSQEGANFSETTYRHMPKVEKLDTADQILAADRQQRQKKTKAIKFGGKKWSRTRKA